MSLVIAAATAAAVAAIPVGYLVVRLASSDLGRVADTVLRPRTLELAGASLALSATVALGCLLLGIPTAFALTRVALPARWLWRALATLPLAIPSYVAAFAWVATWPGVSGFWPTAAVMILACTPYVTLPVAAALRLSDSRQTDAARTLGARPFAAFRRATLPLLAPAAGAGALLAALYTLSDFGAPALLRQQTLTWAVHAAFQGSIDRMLAASLSIVLVALSALLVLAERRVRRRAARVVVAPGATPHVPTRGWWPRACAMIGLSLIAVPSIVVPLAALGQRLVTGVDGVVDVPRLAEAAVTTLALGLAGAVGALVLALPIATLAARARSPFVAALESSAYLGHVVPGVVVGLSLVFFTLAVVPALYQTTLALILAYAVLFLPKALGSSRAALQHVPRSVEDVARTLGLGRLGVARRVTAPIAVPGIAAGALLAAVTVMKELPATLMLRPIGTETLATELWRFTASAAYGAAAPYALMLVLVAGVPAILLSRGDYRA